MDDNRTHVGWIILGMAIALPLTYIGSYYALVQHRAMADPWHGPGEPTYRVGGQIAEIVFLPMHSVDRHVRPGYWEGATEGWTSYPPLGHDH